MIPEFKLRDVETNQLYAFLTLKQANDFCDQFDHPENLVGVDTK